MAHIETFIQSAWQHLRADRPKQAMDCAKKAHAISPNSPDVAHLLGLLASRDGKPEIALPLLQKAIDTGGKTAQRLRHIAEALLDAGHPQVALTPLNDAIKEFGESSDLFGLKSAIEIALEQWDNAAKTSQQAIDLNPSLMAWELNLSFAQLMQGNIEDGFRNASARPKNLSAGSVCPALMYSQPSEIWLKSEQGLGDTLFYLRYVAPLVKKGWQFHLEADRKLVPLLQNTQLFLSVKEKNTCPKNQFSIHLADLALMALQCGIKEIPPPLFLSPDANLVEKYKQELAKIGPAPYVAVTWRAGPKGSKQRAGVATLEKFIEPKLLGGLLANSQYTVINLQRLPIQEELQQFHQALGRKSADYSALHNNLAGMLALLSVVDEYITVSNTNLHLREGLAKPSHVFVNRPFQDWRWQAEGQTSVWYPNSQVFRQEKDKGWGEAHFALNALLSASQSASSADQTVNLEPKLANSSLPELRNVNVDLLKEGWSVVSENIPLAISKAQDVLASSPENPHAFHLLGWAAVLDLKFEIAEKVLKRATELAPNHGRIWGDYLRSLVLSEQFDKALNLGKTCLDNSDIKAKSYIYYAMAVAYSNMGDYHKAVEHYDLCLSKAPYHLDALAYGGMLRMKLGEGYAMLGFKQFSARQDARVESEYPFWVCPVLKGDVSKLKVLIIGELGLGDELSCLRYLPYLLNAGVNVTYWGGPKLVPLLDRLNLGMTSIPNTQPMPDVKAFDLAFRAHELAGAVEHLNASEVAPPLPLKPDSKLVKKWKNWLKSQGNGPYIGFNWRAGASNATNTNALKKLNKSIDQIAFATCLSNIDATWISLQRNVTKAELDAFENVLQAPIADAAGLADSLEDMLALQSLLDENIGVSNTNMHLRAGLNKGSKVLVQTPYGDWRWGVDGTSSVWFKDCIVYRQNKQGDWNQALQCLQNDLKARYGLRAIENNEPVKGKIAQASLIQSNRLIWITAGVVKNVDGKQTSDLASARYRVITPSEALSTHGWQSEIVNESTSELMGGWGSATPQAGDTVIISKVFTAHAVTLAEDAKSRSARVVLDLCDNFLAHPKRGPLQKALLAVADNIVTSTQAINEALLELGKKADAVISDPVEFKRGEIKFSPGKVLKLLWFGHAVNIDTLSQSLPALAMLDKTTPLQLNVVTTLPNGQQDLDKITPKGLTATYTPWSVSATEEAIVNCDIVIIPTLQSDMKNAKSPNRLLEPLWAGRIVVAGRLPAYLHFADSAWVGKDIVEGIQWCLANPNEVKVRIAQGQADVEKYFTQQAIGQQWDALLNQVHQTTIASTKDFNQPTPSSQTIKQIALLTTQHPSLPSIAIRLIEPLGVLDDCSVKITSGINSQRQLSIDYEVLLMRDLIVVQRDFPSADTMPLLKKLKALGKKLVYETDDAFHLIPEHHSKAFHRTKAPAIFEFAKIADAITVSTNKLADEFKAYGEVSVLPNRLSAQLWNNAVLDSAKQNKAKHKANNIRIGIVGGADHQLDLALLTDAIKTIVNNKRDIEWVAYGDGAVNLLKPHISENKFSAIKTNLDYLSHPNRLAEMSLDIALVPLVDDAFNRCRSNLKFLEFGFLGVATVFSNVESYNTTVVDGETGLLVSNTTESWVGAIQSLIDNQTLREKIGANAQKEVQTNWMLTSQNNGWQALLEKLA